MAKNSLRSLRLNRGSNLLKRILTVQRQQYMNEHDKYMTQNVGADYKEIDKSEDYYEYVMTSPIRKQAMTQSQDARIIGGYGEFLNTPIGKEKFRKEPEPEKPAESPPKQARRQAASGLLKNTATQKVEKKLEDLTDEELWKQLISRS